jgi:glycosyltransferase involved in cell wall biosynthesis
MDLLLYDITLSGHHGTYLSAIAAEAMQRRWRVSVVLPKRVEQHQHFEALRKIVGHPNTFLSDHWVETPARFTRLSLFRHHLAQRRAAIDSLRPFKGKCDFVYAPNIDYMDKAIQFLGAPSYPTPFGGACMRVRFHMKAVGVRGAAFSAAGMLEALTFRRLLTAKGVACVTTADPSLVRFCEAQRSKKFRKVRFFPEMGMDRPSISGNEARTQLGFGAEDRIVLVYGMITERKGIRELFNSLDTLGPNSPIKVVIAGPQDDDTRNFLAANINSRYAQRVRLIDGHVDRDLEGTLFAAANAVWVAYKGHSTMSSVFYQAACCGLPVIASNYGILSWLVEEQGVGISVNPQDPAKTGELIYKLLCGGSEYAGICKNSEELARLHSPANFARAVCDAICGAPA